MPTPRAASILAVDFGNIHTRALLIDLVEGVYTLVAQTTVRTTADFPLADVTVGMMHAVQTLSASTGRRLLTSDNRLIHPEQPDRSGVDVFVATASIGRPLRTVVVGLIPELSVRSGLRAAAGTYVNIVETLSLDDPRSIQDKVNAILMAKPDLFFITGGMENGASGLIIDLTKVVRLAIQLLPSGRAPGVVFAGNSAAAARVKGLLEDITTVFVAENVRPSLEEEHLENAQLQLALAFDSFAEKRGMGFEAIGKWSPIGVQPNAQSYAMIVDFLGKTTRYGGVLAADIGSAISTLSASVNGRTSTSIHTDVGLGHSARALLDAVGIENVRQWLPFAAPDEEIIAYALNKTLRPAAVPEGQRALYFEHALLRAALRGLLDAARPTWTPKHTVTGAQPPLPPFERIIGAGAGLTGTGRPGMTAMLLLDALQPTGITRLQTDSTALVPALGAIARISPEAAVQLLDAGGLDELGTAVNIGGRVKAGNTAAKVQITLGKGQREKHTVTGGGLWLYPLPIGARAEVVVSAARGLNIGGKRRVKFTVEGGSAGLIIDARGRPLPLGLSVRDRAVQIPAWYAQATGDPIREISAEWLHDLTHETETEARIGRRGKDKQAAPKDEGGRRRRRERKPAVSAASPPSASEALDELLPDFESLASPPTGRARRSSESSKPTGDDLDDLRNLLS